MSNLHQGRTGTLSALTPIRRALVITTVALVAAYVVGRLIVPFSDGALHAVLRWGLSLLVYGWGAGACLVRAGRDPRDRGAWLLLGLGLLSYFVGSLIGALSPMVVENKAPAAATAAWLLFYPLAFAGLVLLARGTLRPFTIAFALDGVLAALALAAIVVAVTVPGLSDTYSTADLIAGLTYPAADLLLLGFSAWIAVMAGWRANPAWRWLVLGFALLFTGDVALALQVSASLYSEDAATSTLYPIAMVAIGVAAWQPRGRARALRPDVFALTVLPAAAVATVLIVLVVGQPLGIPGGAQYLCFGVLVLAFVRMALVFGHLSALQEGRRFQQGFEEATIGMAIVDQNLRWVRVNEALARLLGSTPKALAGGAMLDSTAEDERESARKLSVHALESGESVDALPGHMLRRDGTVVAVELSGVVIEGEDGAPQLFAQARDVSGERKSDRQSEAVSRITRAALEQPDIAALMHEITKVVTDALPAALTTIVSYDGVDGAPRLAASDTPLPETVTTPAPNSRGQRVYTVDLGEPVVANDLKTEDRFVVNQMLLMAGLRRAVTVPVIPRNAPAAVMATYRMSDAEAFAADDVRFLEAVGNVLASALERAGSEADHRHRALHDPLTGLANRALLAAHVEHALIASKRQEGQVALLLVDLDRFKQINDTMGHSVGDELLQTVADRLRDRARGGDLVARLGGDEFVVVFDAVESVHEVVPVAQRLIDAIAEPMMIAGRELFVTSSVGIVVAEDAQVDAESLLRDADVAMYRAKAGGGGRYELFDADLRARVVDRLAVESDLRRAVEREELAVYLQPLIDLVEQRPVGFEALVRWDRPDHGLVLPASFIGVAEETGLIVPVGTWVLRDACRRVAELNVGSPVPIQLSVNLSARQITEDLVVAVRSALDDAGMSPGLLTLEITESLLIDDRGAPAVLEALRALGVTLALDDFGTGYSSLGALQRHAVDTLKLDRTMVTAVATSPTAAAIARAAVNMAAALGVNVVAEGIEDFQQLQMVRELGCDVGQGYLFARPMPASEAAAYLRGESWVAAFNGQLRTR
ncbi:MAG: EAL domain-containing protein [Solirubrobacteraceae bacterium]|nr:EAL domain-containing protein [Solirubrobacteraceae bacterium]